MTVAVLLPEDPAALSLPVPACQKLGEDVKAAAPERVPPIPAELRGMASIESMSESLARGHPLDTHRFLRLLSKMSLSLRVRTAKEVEAGQERLFAVVAWMDVLYKEAGVNLWVERAYCALVVIFHRRGAAGPAFRAYGVLKAAGASVPVCTLALLIDLCMRDGDLDRAAQLLAEAEAAAAAEIAAVPEGVGRVSRGAYGPADNSSTAFAPTDGLPSWVSAREGHLLAAVAAHAAALGGFAASLPLHAEGACINAAQQHLARVVELAPEAISGGLAVLRRALCSPRATSSSPADLARRRAICAQFLLRSVARLRNGGVHPDAAGRQPDSSAGSPPLAAALATAEEELGAAAPACQSTPAVAGIPWAEPPAHADKVDAARAVLAVLRSLRGQRRATREDFDDLLAALGRRKGARPGAVAATFDCIICLATLGSSPLEALVAAEGSAPDDEALDEAVGVRGAAGRSSNRRRRPRRDTEEEDAEEEDDVPDEGAEEDENNEEEEEGEGEEQDAEREATAGRGCTPSSPWEEDIGTEETVSSRIRRAAAPRRTNSREGAAEEQDTTPISCLPLGEPPNLHLAPDCDTFAVGIEALFSIRNGGAAWAECLYAHCKREVLPNPSLYSAVIFGRLASGDGAAAAEGVFEMDDAGFCPHHRFLHRCLRLMGPNHESGLKVIARLGHGPPHLRLRLYHGLIEGCMDGSKPHQRAVAVHEALCAAGLEPNADTHFALVKALCGLPSVSSAQTERQRLQDQGLLPRHPAFESLLGECYTLLERKKKAWQFMDTRRCWLRAVLESTPLALVESLSAAWRAASASNAPIAAPPPPEAPAGEAVDACPGLLGAYCAVLPPCVAGLCAAQHITWRYILVRSAGQKAELQAELDALLGADCGRNDSDPCAFVLHLMLALGRLEVCESAQLRLVRMLFAALPRRPAVWQAAHARLLEERAAELLPEVLSEIVRACPSRPPRCNGDADVVPFASPEGQQVLVDLVRKRYLSRPAGGEPVRFSTALRFIRAHGLTAALPDDALLRPILRSFVEGFAQHAYTLCEGDRPALLRLIGYAIRHGRCTVAGRIAERFGLPAGLENGEAPPGWDVSPESFRDACARCVREAEEAEERELRAANAKRIAGDTDANCLRLPKEVAARVMVVASAEELVAAAALFEEAVQRLAPPDGAASGADVLTRGRCLGLDVEWRPSLEKRGGMQKHRRSNLAGHMEPCSLLQVAADDFVVVFDLLALLEQGSPSAAPLSELLGRLFREVRLAKLGFGLQNDLQRLACSYPELDCFRCISCVLDVQEAWLKQEGADCPAGLSALCARQLGRPLSKRLQTSDWGARPLTNEQVLYAALDAHCLIGLARRLRDEATRDLQELRVQATSTGQLLVQVFAGGGARQTDEEELRRVDLAIASKGAEIRALKSAGQPKSAWQADVALLLQLKARFRELSGVDWTPTADGVQPRH